MIPYKQLDMIANGIQAANRIRSLQSHTLLENSRTSVKPGNIELLEQILQIILQYSPESQKKSLGETVNKFNLYSRTYRSLKGHLQSTRGQRFSSDRLIKTLHSLQPAASGRKKAAIEKVLKIYAILKS